MKSSPQQIITRPLLLFAVLLLAAWRLWNVVFLKYMDTVAYRGDIFRDTMQNLFAPVYGFRTDWLPSLSCLPMFLLSALAIYFLYKNTYAISEQQQDKKPVFLAQQNAIYGIALFQFCLTLSFGLTDGLDRWLVFTGHYDGFSLGLPFCKGSFSTLLAQYAQIMAAPKLGAHLNHYPPGNLCLLLLGQQIGFLPLTKIFVALLSVATLWQMRRIANLLDFGVFDTNIILLFYATNAGILTFPSLDFASTLPFFATWLVAAFLKAWRNTNIVAQKYTYLNIEIGMSFCFFTFFSFNVPIIIGFCGLILLFDFFYTHKNSFSLKDIIFFIKKIKSITVINVIFIVFLYYLLYKITNFDIITCFRNSLINNNAQMHYAAFDNFTRYLLRSSGNLLAYLIASLGVISAGLLYLIFKNKLVFRNINNKIYVLSAVSLLFVAAFSTLFIGETERVWLYFTPILIIASAPQLVFFRETFGNRPILLLLSLNLFYALLWECFFNHCW